MEEIGVVFEGIVAKVTALWREANHERAAFPSIAAEVLREAALHTRLTVDDLVGFLVAHPALPQQVDPAGAFGAPPVTVRFEEGFALDIYFWNKPEVVVHNHSFDGAFMVLEGVSLHTLYRLDAVAQHGETLPSVLVGDVVQHGAELLRKGDVRPIVAGLEMVHQVAHLASPCVSVVLRTTPAPSDPPIYDVLPPGIALLQSRYMAQGELKKLALIGLLYRLRGAEIASKEVALMLDSGSDLLAAWGLRTVAHTTQSVDQARAVAGLMTPRTWFEALFASVTQSDTVAVNWDTLPDPGHRLFAMLVCHVPSWELRDRLALEYAPEGHGFGHMAMMCTMQMAQQGFFGVALPPVALVALGTFMAGLDDAAAVEAVAAQQTGMTLDVSHAAQLRQFYNNHPLYRALLASLPAGGVR